MTFDKEPYEAFAIDMTPLVDTIFAIILFLLVVASFEKSWEREQRLPVSLPTQGQRVKGEAPPARPIIVNVRHLGGGRPEYIVNNTRMEIPALTSSLSLAKIRYNDQSVIIRGDKNVTWEHVAAVLGCCAEAGISKVSAAVEIDNGK